MVQEAVKESQPVVLRADFDGTTGEIGEKSRESFGSGGGAINKAIKWPGPIVVRSIRTQKS